MFVPDFFNNGSKGIETEITSKITERIIQHRNRTFKILQARYFELLPHVINYYHDHENILVDWYKLETALRNGKKVVLGMNTENNIEVFGFLRNHHANNWYEFFNDVEITHDDIQPISNKIPDNLERIVHHNNAKTGNYIIIENKKNEFVSDFDILGHFLEVLAEISLSRFTTVLQSKIFMFLIGQVNDTDIDNLASQLLNGSPYIKVGKFFDVNEHIHTLQNSNISSNLQQLKIEYNNKISELNNFLGINSVAIDKNSGVTDNELNANTPFTTSNANIYLSSRNEPLELLNRRFNLDIKAKYDNIILSELNKLIETEVFNSDNTYNNDI